MDSLLGKEVIGFVIPAVLGCVSYVLATACARFISSVPRHVYVGRLIFLGFFTALIWLFYLPLAAVAFSGSAARYSEIGGYARGMGTIYGMQTVWIWCILAVLKWPRTQHEPSA